MDMEFVLLFCVAFFGLFFLCVFYFFFFFQAEDGIRDGRVTGVQTCALPIFSRSGPMLFALIMPIVVLLLFHMGGNPNRPNAVAHNPNLAFPIGAAYCLLLLDRKSVV